MSDIDKLKDDVIEAARDTNARCSSDSHRRLRIVLAALDEAQKPDPWDIVERFVIWNNATVKPEATMTRAKAALEWRKANPDD